MKATELMIGNIVRQKGSGIILEIEEIKPPYIMAIGELGQFHEDTIEPIPLTPEILEKNGFVLEDYSGDFMSGKWWTRDDFVIPENMIDSVGRNNFNYNYVHELQHALKLCRIEKTIEL